MKTFEALYYYRSDHGSLESTFIEISAKSMAEAKRIAKAHVGRKETMRLVHVQPK